MQKCEEIGDKYKCTYGCPVNAQGQGICSKAMMMLFPTMEVVRSGGNLENVGGDSKYTKNIVCPDGCVIFRLTAKNLGNDNFYKGNFFEIILLEKCFLFAYNNWKMYFDTKKIIDNNF